MTPQTLPEAVVRLTRPRRTAVAGAVAALLGSGLGAGTSLLLPQQFTSGSAYFLTTASHGSGDLTDRSLGAIFSNERARTYANVVTSSLVLQPVIDRLGLATDVATLAESINVEVPSDTSVLEVTVKMADPDAAEAVATALSEELPAAIRELDRSGPLGQNQVHVTVLRSASPADPTDRFTLVWAAGGGLLASAAVIARRTRRERDGRMLKTEHEVRETLARLPILDEIGAANGPEPQDVDLQLLRLNLESRHNLLRSRPVLFVSTAPRLENLRVSQGAAASLASHGYTVCLVDANMRAISASDSLGLSDVLAGKVDFTDVVTTTAQGYDQVCRGTRPPNPDALLATASKSRAFVELGGDYDWLFITGASLAESSDALALTQSCSGLVLLVPATRVNVNELTRSFGSIVRADAPVIGAVLVHETKSLDELAQGS